MIVREAQEILQNDLGITGVCWGSGANESNKESVSNNSPPKRDSSRQYTDTPNGKEHNGRISNGCGKLGAPRTGDSRVGIDIDAKDYNKEAQSRHGKMSVHHSNSSSDVKCQRTNHTRNEEKTRTNVSRLNSCDTAKLQTLEYNNSDGVDAHNNITDDVLGSESSCRSNNQRKEVIVQADVHACTTSQSVNVASEINTCATVSITKGTKPTLDECKMLSHRHELTSAANATSEQTLKTHDKNEREKVTAESCKSKTAASTAGVTIGNNAASDAGQSMVHNEAVNRLSANSVTPTLSLQDGTRQKGKDTSPELFSVPQELDLQVVDSNDAAVACSTPNDETSNKDHFVAFGGDQIGRKSNKPISEAENGSVRQADGTLFGAANDDQKTSDVASGEADLDALSPPGAQSDFSPSFPPMDSQMLRLVDEVCAQNEAIARTASPDLTQRTKEPAVNVTKLKVLSRGDTGSLEEYEIDLESCPVEQNQNVHADDVEQILHSDGEHNLEDAVAMDMSDSFDFPADEDVAPNPVTVGAESFVVRPCTVDDQSTSPFSPIYSQLEVDMKLAAEWTDSFSCEESSPQPQLKPQPQQPVDSWNKACDLVKHSKEAIRQRDNEGSVCQVRCLQKLNSNNRNGSQPCTTQSVQNIPDKQSEESTAKTLMTSKTGQCSSRQMNDMKTSRNNSLRDRKKNSNCNVSNPLQDQFSPGTMAMLDMFAGDGESSVQSRNLTSESMKCSKTDEIKNVMAVSSSKLGELWSYQVTHHEVGGQDKTCRKRKSDEHVPSEGVDSLERVSPPKKNKESEASSVRRVSPRRLSRERISQGEEERRTSDGDCVPPTPPKEKPNTPKLLKGTTKKKTLQTKMFSVANGTRRSSQRLRTKQQKSQSIVPKMCLSARKELLNQDTGNQAKKIARNRLDLSPPEDSQALFSERDVDESQVCDMNKALDGSDLDLRLDTSTESALSSPTNRVNPKMSQSSPSMLQLSPVMPCTDGAFTVIDVCTTRELFETFLEEWRSKTEYSFSMACETYQPKVEGGGIGGKFQKGRLCNKVFAFYSCRREKWSRTSK